MVFSTMGSMLGVLYRPMRLLGVSPQTSVVFCLGRPRNRGLKMYPELGAKTCPPTVGGHLAVPKVGHQKRA